MGEIRFNVFGRFIAVRRTPHGWQAFDLGAEGKRRPSEFVIPSFIEEADLGQYLADILHELATPQKSGVIRLD